MPYALIVAIGEAKKGKGKIKVVLSPKEKHALNGKDQPELEIDAKGVLKSKPVKDAKGVGAGKKGEFTVEFEIDPKTPAGETVVAVEIKVVDVDGKDKTPHTIQVSVPVVVK
jgi:hypothetical protein